MSQVLGSEVWNPTNHTLVGLWQTAREVRIAASVSVLNARELVQGRETHSPVPFKTFSLFRIRL